MKEMEYVVALVGGSTLLGKEMVTVLQEHSFPCSRLVALVERDGELAHLTFHDEEVSLAYLEKDIFHDVDLVFFADQDNLVQQWGLPAIQGGCAVVDCSDGLVDDDPAIPVVAYGLNDELIDPGQPVRACSLAASLQLATILKPLHHAWTVKRVVVSTYESVSEQGQAGIKELEDQLRQLLTCQEAQSEIFPYQIAFNCLPHIGTWEEGDTTSHEHALIRETRMLLGDPDLPLTATACWVPTLFGHALSVSIETVQPCSPKDARIVLAQTEGITLLDNPGEQMYPMPLIAAGHDDIFVGRIRQDTTVEHGLTLWIVGDNIRNQAVNAVRIGECLYRKKAHSSANLSL